VAKDNGIANYDVTAKGVVKLVSGVFPGFVLKISVVPLAVN